MVSEQSLQMESAQEPGVGESLEGHAAEMTQAQQGDEALELAARTPSFLRKRVASIDDEDWLHDRDLEEALVEHRARASASWGVFLGLAYKSIGVVYGDLGTSPMYLWQTCFTFPATEADIVGATSLVLWTMSLLVVVKYAWLVLPANDLGEGGTFAVYSLICRHAKITPFGLRHESDKGLSQYSSKMKRPKRGKAYPGRLVAKALETSPQLQKALLIVVLCGTCALVGDGVLTPAVTVLSAMTGLQIAPDLVNSDGSTKIPNGVVIGATCAIMAGIFILQRFGTSKIGIAFAPILSTFFLVNAAIGIYNIQKWDTTIFKAFSPHYGIEYLVRNGKEGWISLGGICLCITGVEGLFADLGHFNVASIRTSTMTVVYPSLLLIYLGQGAYFAKNPGDVSQGYFKAIPHDVYWPVFVVATLAAIVASQAIISGTFSVIAQSMSLQCFPRVKVVHTSKVVRGQIYIPEVNWALMVLGIACVLGFSLPQPMDEPVNGNALGHAFGIAVMSVMVITTCLVTLVMLIIWRTHPALIALFFGFFFTFESVYLSSNLYKVTHGGYVPVAIAFIVVGISYVWHWGSTKRYMHSSKLGTQLEDILEPEEGSYTPFSPDDDDMPPPGPAKPIQLCLKSSGQKLAVTRGAALFYSDTLNHLPPIFPFVLKSMPAVHEIMIFLTIREVPVPNVLMKERLLVKQLAYPGFYRVVARYGYMDHPDHSPAFAREVLNAIAHYLTFGSRKELLPRSPTETAPTSPMSTVSSSGNLRASPFGHVSSSGNLSGSPFGHVSSSTALNAEAARSPRTEPEIDAGPPTPIKRPMRLSVAERGSQLKTLKQAAFVDVMYLKTRSILKAAPGSSFLHRFVLETLYNGLVGLSRSPTSTLNIPTSQMLVLSMVYEL